MAACVVERLSKFKEDSFGLWDDQYVVSEKVSDELLAYGYLRFEKEGLLPYIFYEGVPGLKWFLDQFGGAKMDVLGCFEREPDGKLTLCGFTWLNSKTPVGKLFTKAESGWAFFRNQKETMRWAKLSVEYAFRYLGVSALFGSTPVKNRAAIIAAKRTGFKVIGELPCYTAWEGIPCAVAISHLTKEDWYRREES